MKLCDFYGMSVLQILLIENKDKKNYIKTLLSRYNNTLDKNTKVVNIKLEVNYISNLLNRLIETNKPDYSTFTESDKNKLRLFSSIDSGQNRINKVVAVIKELSDTYDLSDTILAYEQSLRTSDDIDYASTPKPMPLESINNLILSVLKIDNSDLKDVYSVFNKVISGKPEKSLTSDLIFKLYNINDSDQVSNDIAEASLNSLPTRVNSNKFKAKKKIYLEAISRGYGDRDSDLFKSLSTTDKDRYLNAMKNCLSVGKKDMIDLDKIIIKSFFDNLSKTYELKGESSGLSDIYGNPISVEFTPLENKILSKIYSNKDFIKVLDDNLSNISSSSEQCFGVSISYFSDTSYGLIYGNIGEMLKKDNQETFEVYLNSCIKDLMLLKSKIDLGQSEDEIGLGLTVDAGGVLKTSEFGTEDSNKRILAFNEIKDKGSKYGVDLIIAELVESRVLQGITLDVFKSLVNILIDAIKFDFDYYKEIFQIDCSFDEYMEAVTRLESIGFIGIRFGVLTMMVNSLKNSNFIDESRKPFKSDSLIANSIRMADLFLKSNKYIWEEC